MIQNTPSARLISCSKHPEQDITVRTFELEYWRPIHGEVMTHRVFTRNAGSSRARPSAPINVQVASKPWGPSHWGKNGKGMQAHGDHDEYIEVPLMMEPLFVAFASRFYPGISLDRVTPEAFWHFTAWLSGRCAQAFTDAGYHKQVTNRITEPYTSIKVVLTTTDLANFYGLRDHRLAQPEIQELARAMKAAEAALPPKILNYGEWHLPYADRPEDWEDARRYLYAQTGLEPSRDAIIELLKKMSAARCARVSYNLFDGTRADIESDLRLFNDLLVDQPIHASPAEHQATPMTQDVYRTGYLRSNLRHFIQHRKLLPNENMEPEIS